MNIADLFSEVSTASIQGNRQTVVTGMSLDSKRVEKGDLFVALRGSSTDGRNYIHQAIQKGATAVAMETASDPSEVPTICFPEVRKHLGRLAARVYGEPALALRVVGITGTNGKTTTAHLLEAFLQASKRAPGYIGTIEYRWGDHLESPTRTTPEAPDLHRMLRNMCDANTSDVVIECSSHGLSMHRLDGLDLDVAVFTNLTPDHLDFHASMNEYQLAKWKLFNPLLKESRKTKKAAVLNLDDPVGRAWATKLPGSTTTYSLSDSTADLHVLSSNHSERGFEAEVSVLGKKVALRSKLIGEYNIANVLAALATGCALDLDVAEMANALDEFECVPGRLERVPNSRGVHVFVDYAHTPDALENVLSTLRPLSHNQLIVVFGCGGNRDRQKRPDMGKAVARYADVAVVTSDNPRTEDPDAIINEIVGGLPTRVGFSFERHSDRRQAIARALEISQSGDLLLIAGKGHETYQESNGTRLPFDDREVARQ